MILSLFLLRNHEKTVIVSTSIFPSDFNEGKERKRSPGKSDPSASLLSFRRRCIYRDGARAVTPPILEL